MEAISIIVIGLCIISAIERRKYHRETERKRKAFNAWIDRQLETIRNDRPRQ